MDFDQLTASHAANRVADTADLARAAAALFHAADATDGDIACAADALAEAFDRAADFARAAAADFARAAARARAAET